MSTKLKNMFKKPKDRSSNQQKSKEFIFTEELQKDISNESSMEIRLRTLKELGKIVTDNRLDQEIIAKLIYHTQDLLTNQPDDVRRSAFIFFQHLAGGQRERMDLTRTRVFKIIKDHTGDISERFDLLQALTDNGKDIKNLEFEIAPFLLGWFCVVLNAEIIDKYLSLLDTMIKYNAGYIEEDVITGLVRHISVLCRNPQESAIKDCLKIFETIIAYSNLLPDFLPLFVGTLCRTVSIESHCELSWNIMRKLLGTHMGHSSLLTMCSILRQESLKNDLNLLRGAIFYIGMALWGKQPLTNLRCSVCAILPSVYQAVQYFHPVISYEVMTCVSSLIVMQGADLQDAAWDTVLNILSVIIRQVESEPDRIPNSLTKTALHDTLTGIENLVESRHFNGSVNRFFEIIGECSRSRPEKSVLLLITHLSGSIKPTQHLWLNSLYNLLQRYFKEETRTNIRLKVLELLGNVVNTNRILYEDELIDKIVVHYLSYIVDDGDNVVRSCAAELLISLCMECESKRCLEMLDILEKLLKRPFETNNDNQPIDEVTIFDVKTVVSGLIKVFTYKIHKLPSSHAVKIYKMLVNFLHLHYSKPKLFENCIQLRYKIFDCFLNMRADSLYHLGCPDANGEIKYSSYLCVTYTNEKGPMTSPPPTSPAVQSYVTYVSVKYAFKMFITCLKMEKVWEVLHHVLNQLPNVLRNKTLILTKLGNPDMHLIVEALATMVSHVPETVQINKSQYNAAVLSVMANLASYHACLNTSAQQDLIGSLYKYLSLHCAKLCITALTICTLEMQEVMVKMLPQVLLSLSKISATVGIAIPVLEFLSTLTVLPKVFANFVADQYMTVFAISLPYTYPFKYNHYIVSLAYHVIAVWFLKCRVPFRKDFVQFIINGLQTNALTPRETQYIKPVDLNKLNQDSSDRKRSSSLTEQGSRRPARSSTVVSRLPIDFKIPIDKSKSTATFYQELMETCIDLMARYAFSTCSALPRRLPTTEFLLSGGQSMSWLLGNKVITVTTSGCSQKALKFGLCDKCYTTCKNVGRTPDDAKLKSMRSSSTEKDAREDSSNRVTRQNSGDKSNPTNTSTSSPIEESKRLADKLEQLPSKLQQLTVRESNVNEKLHCACWCQGWAEIYVRRPTGDMSWAMRIQNQLSYQCSMYEFPLNEISTLFSPFVPKASGENSSFDRDFARHHSSSQEEEYSTGTVPISIPGSPNKHSPSRQSSRDSIDEDLDNIYEDGSKSRNPVRRSNSSPEMSANWKNPFLQQRQQERDELRVAQDDECIKKMKKDMRVSCEAIPEEMAGMGTTPPTETLHQAHPSLLSSLSFPGTTPPSQDPIPKNYQTVPPSPNVTQTTAPPLTLHSGGYGMRPGILKSSKSDSIDSMSSDKSAERPTTLPSLTNLAPLTSKPPQSPTQTSPRLSRHLRDKEAGNEIQKSSSLVIEKTNLQYLKGKDRRIDAEKLTQSDQDLNSQTRSRGHTISVMSPARKPRPDLLRHTQNAKTKEAPKSGISPSFIFLQLFHASHFENANEKPLLIDSNEIVQRALTVLDFIPPHETHKIGVIYVGQGQANNETEILRNTFGSFRYVEFLRGLGTLIKLSDADPQVTFLGGLEQNGTDGNFSYIWQDDVIRVIFHVATLMPTRESDRYCNDKKKHIGNDNVTIVYNESGEDYQLNTIKGQFNFACIVIQPLDHCTNQITVKAKDELLDLIGHPESKIVSDQNVAILARQLALHANLASLVCNSLKNANQNPYASNWLERLRKIKNLRNKVLQESKKKEYDDKTTRGQMEDFTDYT